MLAAKPFLTIAALTALLLGLDGASLAGRGLRYGASLAKRRVAQPATVSDRLAEHGESVRTRLEPYFQKAGVEYPPARLVLAAFKDERTLELHAASAGSGELKFIRSYPILAASGGPGPKLREGDLQVPEGIYRIESLNPNSMFHLSLRVNYPNAFDREQARRDSRARLGGDIMIHGNQVSIGCLAMGDPAAEELFVLAAKTGLPRIKLLIAPLDLRSKELPQTVLAHLPPWVPQLYREIRRALIELAEPRKSGA